MGEGGVHGARMLAMPDATDAFAHLRPIGWSDDAELVAAAQGRRVARVTGQHRSGFEVAEGPDKTHRVQPPAPWTRPRGDPELRAIIGDWVALDEPGTHIVELLPRRALLKRGAAGEHHRVQLIAANIDHVIVVVGLDDDFNARRIERYLLVIQASGASPVLVLTKADRFPDVEGALEELKTVNMEGTPVHAVNAKSVESTMVLHQYLGPGKSAVLVGSSGAGKSTLTNTLLGVERMKTKAVRESDSRGRHTTTYRALIPLPTGACLIDTPGMRELKPTGEEDVAENFSDIEALAEQCRFRDCVHQREPGCAVRTAIEAGKLDPQRFANFLKLSDEVTAAANKAANRRAQKSDDKEQGKPVNKCLEEKFGKR